MTETIEAPSEINDQDARFWHREIKAAKERREDWYKSADKAIDRYEDGEDRAFGAFNILWANVETQKSYLDDDFGKPEVTRMNAQGHDALARHVSSVLEQATDAAVKDTDDNLDITQAMHGSLLSGLGQVWLDLNVQLDEQGGVAWVDAPLVCVPFRDYLEGPADRWGDVPWVARAHLYSLDDLRALDRQTGMQHADAVPREYSLPLPADCRDGAAQEQFKRARVWEIWSKFPSKRRVYVAEDYPTALRVTPDPYRLRPFFPCPRPIVHNAGKSPQIPRTDYSRYYDQAAELDRISQRIYVLTEVLKHHGVYDERHKELANLPVLGDNKLIAIPNFSEFVQNGGLASAVQYMDMTTVIGVLTELHKQRAELIQLIYELSGISDLARGQTDPNETLGAQQLKRTFGSGRFKARFDESRRFARDAYALKAELIAEHFQRPQIQEMSGIALPVEAERMQARQTMMALQQAMQSGQQPPMDQQAMEELQKIAAAPFTWEQISVILRSDRRRCYMVEVETDQTEFDDEQAEQKGRLLFVETVNQLFQQFGPMIAGNPANGAIFKQLIIFALSAFKIGRSQEEAIERAIDNAVGMASQQQGQQQPQDPVAAAQAAFIQVQGQREQQKIQLDAQKAQVEAETSRIELAMKQLDLQIKQAELQIKQFEVQAKVAGHQIDLAIKADKYNNPGKTA